MKYLHICEAAPNKKTATGEMLLELFMHFAIPVISPFICATIFYLPVVMYLNQTGAALNFFRWFLPTMISNVSKSTWYVYVLGSVLGTVVGWILACFSIWSYKSVVANTTSNNNNNNK